MGAHVRDNLAVQVTRGRSDTPAGTITHRVQTAPVAAPEPGR